MDRNDAAIVRQRQAWELVYRTARSLATTSGGLRERLRDAYSSHLAHLMDDDVPPGLLPRVIAIHARMTRRAAAGDEGRVAATTGGMTEEEARRVAGEIVSLCDAMTRQLAGEEAPS